MSGGKNRTRVRFDRKSLLTMFMLWVESPTTHHSLESGFRL